MMRFKHNADWMIRVGWFTVFALGPLGNTSIGLLIVGLALLAGMRRSSSEGKLPTTPHTITVQVNRAFLCLVAVAVISALISPMRTVAIPLSIGFTILIGAAIFGGERVSKEFLIGRLLPALAISSTAAAALSLVRYVIERPDRASGVFAGINGWATLILLVTGPVVGYLDSRRSFVRYFSVPYVVLMGAALLVTKTRGAWIGFAVLLAVAGIVQRKTRWLLVMALLAVVVFSSTPVLRDRLVSAFVLSDNMNRVQIWRASIDMIRDHPAFGVGAGVYGHLYDTFRVAQSAPSHVAYAHNLFLQVASEFGLIGLVVFVALLLPIVVAAFRLASLGYPLYAWTFASIIGVLFHQQVDGTIWKLEVGGLFWFFVGIILSLYSAEANQGALPTKVPSGRARQDVNPT